MNLFSLRLVIKPSQRFLLETNFFISYFVRKTSILHNEFVLLKVSDQSIHNDFYSRQFFHWSLKPFFP